jgi:hypothetical protein
MRNFHQADLDPTHGLDGIALNQTHSVDGFELKLVSASLVHISDNKCHTSIHSDLHFYLRAHPKHSSTSSFHISAKEYGALMDEVLIRL